MAVIDLLVFGPLLRTLDALEGELAAQYAAGVADAWRSDDGRDTVLNPALRDAATAQLNRLADDADPILAARGRRLAELLIEQHH